MNLYLSLLVATLVTIGIYSLLQPNLLRMIIGVIVLSNAANLIVFISAGLGEKVMPIINRGEQVLSLKANDPVPQALILTAIVIGFGVTAYFLVLCREYFRDNSSDDFDFRSFE